MALLNVNPTRMELLKLKKRIVTARRGHKLLKEKRDGLMREFMIVIKEAKILRFRVEDILGKSFSNFMMASSVMRPEAIESALMVQSSEIKISAATKNVMSVNIPEFNFEITPKPSGYGFLGTSGEMDIALDKFKKSLNDLIQLSTIEKSAALLAVEIEKTRRRVNALEYILIPDLEETMKYIYMKLAEQERSGIATLMVVKEMLEKQTA
ncbi:MAG: V-type ATP synthase subunit D [bacterium]